MTDNSPRDSSSYMAKESNQTSSASANVRKCLYSFKCKTTTNNVEQKVLAYLRCSLKLSVSAIDQKNVMKIISTFLKSLLFNMIHLPLIESSLSTSNT